MANPYVKQSWTDSVSQTTAARMGVMETGIYDAHFAPAARVYHNASQSITNTTVTTLAFNSERKDQDGLGTSTIHDNVTNNSRLIVRVAGVYQVTANVDWQPNATGIRILQLMINGATVCASDSRAGNSSFDYQNVTSLCDMAVNDYFTAAVWQSSGGALNVLSSAQFSPEFMCVRVA